MARIKSKRRDRLFFTTTSETNVPGAIDFVSGGRATDAAMEKIRSDGGTVTDVSGGIFHKSNGTRKRRS